MKKIILLIILPIFCFAQESEQVIRFDDYKVGYSKMKISFGGKYSSKFWKFKTGDQIIYFSPDDLTKAADSFEAAFNKALEWDKIADENDVEKLSKDMTFTFKTTRGMLEDSGYESVGPKDADFSFERFVSSANETFSYLKTSIWQNGEYNIRSAFFSFPSVNVRDAEQVAKFSEFLNFIKSNKSIIEEKLKDSKADLFN